MPSWAVLRAVKCKFEQQCVMICYCAMCNSTFMSFSLVRFSKAICIAQLNRMSHCAPAVRNPVRFKFMPETHVGDVLVA